MWPSVSAGALGLAARTVLWFAGLGVVVVACSHPNAAKPRAGAAPTRVSGIYLCLPPDPVAAYDDRAYPTNYPAPPPRSARPGRCFGSTARAARAGYALARTPAHDLLIGGVYLVPTSPSIRALCRRSIRAAELAVPCPTLVPGVPSSLFCDTATPCAQPGWFVLEGSFAGGPGYVGVSRGGGHLWIIAFTRRDGVWPQDTLAGGNVIDSTRVLGHRATFVSYPAGSRLNSGHVVLIWRDGGTTYAVSLHGHTTVNERLDLAIASHLQLLKR